MRKALLSLFLLLPFWSSQGWVLYEAKALGNDAQLCTVKPMTIAPHS